MRQGSGGRHGFEQLHHYITTTMDTLVYFIIGLVVISVVIKLVMRLVAFLSVLAAKAVMLFTKIGAAVVFMLIVKGALLLQGKVEEIKHSPQVQEISASWSGR